MSLNFDDITIYTLLLKVCSRYKVDPSSSLEAEDYFRNLLATYDGTFEEESQFMNWLDKIVSGNFIALNKRQQWIQNSEWPFEDGEPMIFVGQIDISRNSGLASEFFHDDTTFYVFIPHSKGKPRVIMQQF